MACFCGDSGMSGCGIKLRNKHVTTVVFRISYLVIEIVAPTEIVNFVEAISYI
jgi:hypothetical protein